jgi:hypothetical protein
VTRPQHRPGDKDDLSPRRRYRETSDCNGCAKRMIPKLGERIAQEDPEDLHHLLEVEQELRQAWEVAIAGIRRSGVTDRQIGEVLGTTKQAVAQRWPRGTTS